MATTTNVPRMDDAALVQKLRAGDAAAFATLYDSYADRLFTYARTLVPDVDTAADVVHDTFLLAHERIDQLRDPDSLRPWLYAITRSQASRVIRLDKRGVEFDSTIDLTDHDVLLDRALDADEARLLVSAALAGLNAGDREVIELSLRHELNNASIAAAIGQSSSHTSALVTRAKQQFDASMSAVLLMKTRGRDCGELRSLLGQDETLTPLLRKRIVRHLKSCDQCATYRRAAIAVLPGVAMAIPMSTAPDSLRPALVSPDGSAVSGQTPWLTQGQPPSFGPDGFPEQATRRHRRALVAGVVAVSMVAVVGGGALIAGAQGSTSLASSNPSIVVTTSAAPASARPSTTPAATPLSVGTTPSAPTSTGPPASRGPGPQATSRPSQQAPSPPQPTKAPPPPPPPPPPPATPTVAVQWASLDSGPCSTTWDARVSATVAGATASSVVARWTPAGGGGASTPLANTAARTWQGVVSGMPTKATSLLTVTVTTTQGISVTTTPQSMTRNCPE